MWVRVPPLAPKGEIMEYGVRLDFELNQLNQHLARASIIVPQDLVHTLFNHTAQLQQNSINTYGFSQGKTPLAYIKNHYKASILNHTKEILLKYIVMKFLYDQLYIANYCVVGMPRILDIKIEPDKDAHFCFEVSLFPLLDFKEWKHFPFKAPKRKQYKDIDRQVDFFIEQETEALEKNSSNSIAIGDWVFFDISFTDSAQQHLLKNHHESLWLKIGNEEVDEPIRNLFLDKKIGDEFFATNACVQLYFSPYLAIHHLFFIKICYIVPHAYFSFNDFKDHFKVKTNKEMHQKLIEVFSFRDDISQRRAMAEEACKLLLTKHPFDIPNHFILREKELVLEEIHNNPDYLVYKAEKNFENYIQRLATKRVKEKIIIDQIALQEQLSTSPRDIHLYVNLLKRARTKEFIYFCLPFTKINGQEAPISSSIMHQCCVREKTLNHIIYHLTKK